MIKLKINKSYSITIDLYNLVAWGYEKMDILMKIHRPLDNSMGDEWFQGFKVFSKIALTRAFGVNHVLFNMSGWCGCTLNGENYFS